MADLYVTLVEVTPKEAKAYKTQEVKETPENPIDNNVIEIEKQYECEKSDRVFPKEQKKELAYE